MKLSYMLINRSGKARKVPQGQAWQWIHYLEDESQLALMFAQLKRKIRDNRLVLANLHIEHTPSAAITGASPALPRFAYKGPIIFDNSIRPQRVFHQTEELPEANSQAPARVALVSSAAHAATVPKAAQRRGSAASRSPSGVRAARASRESQESHAGHP
jgi:hypothetical protein